MELLKIICPVCGSNKLIDNGTRFKCVACGTESIQHEKLTEEKVKLISALYDAESFIRMSPPKFDFAEEKYRIIVHDFPNEASAFWGLFKAKNDIKYIDGKPICFNYENKNVLNDSDFKDAIKNASKEEQQKYNEEIKKIAENIQEWENRTNELNYDVFISFNSHNDKDNNDATNLNSYLVQNGFKVFFSPVEMKNKVGEPNYDAFIFNALAKARVLIVIGSKKESFESDWVKSEWSRYSYLMDNYNKENDSLIVCYEDINPYDLDIVLRKRQMINMAEKNCYETIRLKISNILLKIYNKKEKNKINRITDSKLVEYERTDILEKLPKKEFNSNFVIKNEYNIKENFPKVDLKHSGNIYISNNQNNDNIDLKINRIKRLLERHEYDFVEEFILELTRIDPNNPNFIMYKLLFDYKCGTFEELINSKIDYLIDEDMEKLSSIIEYSSEENATLILSTLSHYVLQEIHNENYIKSFKVYRGIVYYDEKIIVELRHNIIDVLLSKNQFCGVFVDIIDMTMKYLVNDIDTYRNILKKILERLQIIQLKNYVDDSKYDVLIHYFEMYSKVSNLDYDYYIFKIKIENKTEFLDEAIKNLAAQNRIAELDDILDNTDEKSAVLIINDIINSIDKLFDSKEFDLCYDIFKIILQFDFPDKTKKLLYFVDKCISVASDKNEKIFILVISVLNELLQNEEISYYKNVKDFFVRYDSDWSLIEKYANLDEIKKIVIAENCNHIDYKILNKLISLEELEIRNDNFEINKCDLKQFPLKRVCMSFVLLRDSMLTDVPEIKIINSKEIISDFFRNNKNLRKLIIDEGLEKIGDNSFYGCENLKEIELPSTLKVVSNNSFTKCFFETAKLPLPILYKINKSKILDLFIIGDGEIDLSLINGCVSLKKLTIGYGFTSIKKSKSNDNFNKLKSIDISNSVKSIEYGVLSDCYSLESITIPFVGDKRHELNDENQPPFGYLFGKSKSNKMDKINQYKYSVGYSVVGYELDTDHKLRSIKTPYEYCSLSLREYYIPNSLNEIIITDCEYITHGLFSNCENLTNIKLPSNLKVIGDYAFYNCSALESIDIPENVTCIGYSSFKMSGCKDIDNKLTILRNEDIESTTKTKNNDRFLIEMCNRIKK